MKREKKKKRLCQVNIKQNRMGQCTAVRSINTKNWSDSSVKKRHHIEAS